MREQDVDELELSSFRYGGVKMTGFSLVDMKQTPRADRASLNSAASGWNRRTTAKHQLLTVTYHKKFVKYSPF